MDTASSGWRYRSIESTIGRKRALSGNDHGNERTALHSLKQLADVLVTAGESTEIDV